MMGPGSEPAEEAAPAAPPPDPIDSRVKETAAERPLLGGLNGAQRLKVRAKGLVLLWFEYVSPTPLCRFRERLPRYVEIFWQH